MPNEQAAYASTKYKRWSPKDIPVIEHEDRHGPDAAQIATESDPNLVQSRLLLNKLIESPPNGSIPMLIDRHMAQAMLERNNGNRPISQPRIKVYIDALRRGEWKHNGETIKFTSCGLLNDGQHRLTAIARSEVSAMIDVRFGLDRATFDTIDLGKVRSATDVFSIYNIPNASIVASAARLLWRYEQETRMIRYSPSHQQLEAVLERHPLLVEGARVADRLKKTGLYKSPTAFVWTLAAEYDRAKADDFFDRVASGLDITETTDPVWKLREYVASNRANRKVASEDMAAVTVKAWKAYLAGKPIKHLRWRRDGDSPETFPVAPTKANSAPQQKNEGFI